MNHDDENELFRRLEDEMQPPAVPDPPAGGSAADPGGDWRSRKPSNRDGDGDGDPDAASVYGLAPGGPVVVDGPQPTGPGFLDRVRGAKRRPLVPAWLTSRADFAAAARWTAGYCAHLAGYHAIRTPVYLGRLAVQAPRGAAKVVGGTARWVADAEAEPVRLASVRREDAAEYLRLARLHDARVRLRALLILLAGTVGLGTALTLCTAGPAWLRAVSAAALALCLGWVGTPADRPVATRAVELPKVSKLTSDMVLRALGALGIAQINQAVAKGRDGFTFTAPITRDGPGWRAEGDLPYGVTVSDVMDRRDRLASGLRRPLGCVWPEAVPSEHTGRLVLWVGDQDMNKAPQPAWPLLNAGRVDLFKPAPFATDQRGRQVELTLMYIAAVIGAIPRMGKTFLLRLLLLIAALDPRAELHTFDLKGTGDLDPVGDAVAHSHRAGEDDEDIAYALEDLRAVRTELRRRAKVIRSLPRDLCPESKVTSDLADRASLGLYPIVIGVDECQKWFEHPKYGAELEEICTDLVKRGPATGIVIMLATQRPDAKSLPTGISANASVRLCLKVMGQLENDMVLGTSSYKNGIRATTFAWADKGIAYFVGEGADARIVRAVNIDAPTAEAVAARARALRERLGLLTGYAAGTDTTAAHAPSFDLLADILAVVPAAEPKVWNETVAARLAELRPEVYGGWEAEQLTSALKPHGVSTGQVWGKTEDGKGANRRGITRADIAAAVAHRDGNRDAS